ncbi:MAG: DUF418 domain-containing protein [Reichenbachiella sp.]|uniref:DUF418 domain-containing protein n=1 Tax=Reichenbachiella sp. TaxID=2184521 RepID=UPI003297315C
MPEIIKPTQTNTRLSVLDFLRGIAVLGILVINIESFSYPSPWSPYQNGFFNSIDTHTRFWVFFLAQGKFFGMFTLLFGVGFYMFLERLEQKNIGVKALDIYARRLLWLFVIGVVHAYLIWDGDVLYHYAICGFLLFPFRSFSVKQLLLVLVIPVSVLLFNSYERTKRVKNQYEAYQVAEAKLEVDRTEDDQKKIDSWLKKTVEKKKSDERLEPIRNHYFDSIAANAENHKIHQGYLMYNGILFRTLIMMLLGILLYKTGIFKDYHALPYYWWITGGIVVISLVVNYFRYYHWTYTYFNPVIDYWKGWLFTFPKELGGLSYILLLNGIYQKFLGGRMSKLISNMGRMALTNYIVQSIICGFIFYGYGFGLYGQYSRFELLVFIFGIWIFQILASWLWLKKLDQGPLEALWRKLTYRSF